MRRDRLSDEIAIRYRNDVRRCRLMAAIPTQQELSRITGIHRSVLSGIERNRRFLSSAYALRIAEAIGCRVDDLFVKVDADPVRGSE